MSPGDRIMRILIASGVGLAYYLDLEPGMSARFIFCLAGLLALTGATGYCPLYAIFRWSSAKKKV